MNKLTKTILSSLTLLITLGFVSSCYYTEHHCIEHLVKVEAKDATCTIDGFKEHYLCKNCGKDYFDQNATIQVSREDVTIKASHSYATPTYNYDETLHTCEGRATCNACNYILIESVEGSKTVVKEATSEESGINKYSFTFSNSIFSYEDVEEEVPQLYE